MSVDDHFLSAKLEERRQQSALRVLRLTAGKIDLCSNDYLGIVRNQLIDNRMRLQMATTASNVDLTSGSSGSRLLAGNYPLIVAVEKKLASFHEASAGLIFNSGYDANTGLLSAVPQRGDTVLYDQLSHASLRDGIRLSFASAFAFRHNDVLHLEERLQAATGRIFVVTESVFSMDGDQSPLQAISRICKKYQALLIVDEAHATGVVGERGEGLVQVLGLQQDCFGRIHTFGKACGAHGAIVLGSERLKDYLVNFSRQLIYTTALPPISVSAIDYAYDIFPALDRERTCLARLIQLFQQAPLPFEKPRSQTPVQVVIIPGNEAVKRVAERLQSNNMDVRAILYPTVPKDSERLRIVLHSFNTEAEVALLISTLQEK